MKSDVVEILILAGGRGTRLASVVNDLPKPMAPIQDKPFLEILIQSIKVQGFRNFRLLVGHKAEAIQNYFGDGSNFGITINYTSEQTPLGTGGAVKKALQESSFENFLIFNGDTLFEADLAHFINSSKNYFSIALKYFENCERYGQVVIDKNFKIKTFTEKGDQLNDGLINVGIYFFNKNVLNFFPAEESFSIEKEVMPKLADSGVLLGIPLGGKFIDIGIPEDYKKAQTFLSQFKFTNRTPALFLDRDGVIIKDSGYVSSIDDVELFSDIIPIIKIANQKNIPVYIVTNQAGVAHGYFSMEKCHEINDHVIEQLKKNGANIEDCFICPYHPQGKKAEFLKDSLLRKPNPGMVLLAQEKQPIDISRSIMIGDKASDVILLPGLQTILIKRNYDLSKAPANVKIFENLESVASMLKEFY
jgi:histidinol-phosphate phosphatase family protein